MDNTIPCEICNQNIDFNNYIQHCETCYIQSSISNHIVSNQIIMGNRRIISRASVPLDIELTHLVVNLNEYEINEQMESLNGGPVNTPASNIEKCFETVENDRSFTCTICLDDATDKAYVKTVCNHFFCRDCIKTWLSIKHKCPICQHDFNE